MSALGALFGGGGAPDAGGGGGDPEALLSQILDLMNQYLALGPETPAYQTISEALPAIQEAAGGGGAAPDPTGGAPDAGMPPADAGGSPMDTMMPSSPPSSMADASAMALDDMKKRRPRP
jgi:hypothetical protein